MSTPGPKRPEYRIMTNAKIAGHDLVAGDIAILPDEVVSRLAPGVVKLRSVYEAEQAEAERQRRQAVEDAARQQAAEAQEKIGARLRAVEMSGPKYAQAVEDARARRFDPIMLRRKQMRGDAPWPERDAAPKVEVIERSPVREHRGPADMTLVRHAEMPVVEDARTIPDRDVPSRPMPPEHMPGGAAALIEAAGDAYGAALAAARRRFGGEAA